MTQFIDHVAVAVRDADAAAGWFLQRLGLRRVHDERLPDIGVRLVHLAAPDSDLTTLQLVQPIGPGPVHQFLAERGEGLHHICFAVADIAAELAGPVGEPSTPIVPGGRSSRTCFLAARPSGVLVELVSRPVIP